jgi:chromosome partitioning protein
MQVILCTHNKGGVGKTELAIHMVGVLSSNSARILLVDCDNQADAWKFFRQGHDPQGESQVHKVSEGLRICWNSSLRRVVCQADHQQYDYVVIDVDAALEDTVTNVPSLPAG